MSNVLSLLVVKPDDNAGGVRTGVGDGAGVSVGIDVAVGWRAASAVWIARVEMVSTSRVGAAGEGAHEASSIRSSIEL